MQFGWPKAEEIIKKRRMKKRPMPKGVAGGKRGVEVDEKVNKIVCVARK